MIDQKEVIHPTHKSVRVSDASSFDLICDDCGATDQLLGGYGTLTRPCHPPNDGFY